MTLNGYVFVGFALILVVCIDVWILSSILRSDHPASRKVLWSAVVIVLPLLGWAIWGRFGPRGMAYPPSSARPNSENAYHESPSPSLKPPPEKTSYQELP